MSLEQLFGLMEHEFRYHNTWRANLVVYSVDFNLKKKRMLQTLDLLLININF